MRERHSIVPAIIHVIIARMSEQAELKCHQNELDHLHDELVGKSAMQVSIMALT